VKQLRWSLLGLLVVAAVIWWTTGRSNSETLESVVAEREDLVLSVDVSGTLQAEQSESITPPQLKHMWEFKISMIAPEGSLAQSGAPILAFDSSELQRRMQRQMAERDASRKRIEKGERELALQDQQDRLRLAEAEAVLGKARLTAGNPEELTAARDVALLRLDLELAEKEVRFLETKLAASTRSAEATLAALRDQFSRAEQRVIQTQSDIDATTIKAPRDGTVIYASNWNDEKKKVGDACWKGESILSLPDLSRMNAMGTVHEADAGRIAVGQSVKLRLDAHADVEFHGHVASIWRTVQRESWRTERRVVRLEIELDETDEQRMRPGMRFRGRIEVERIDAVVTVDADAVFLEEGGPVVYRRGWRGWKRHAVEVGQRNDAAVEILSGLEPGTTVSLVRPGREGV
jgi:HlyD family secretion protein